MGTGSQKDTLNERAAQCVERLQTGLTPVASVLDGTREIPVAPGIYSWWVLNDALPDVPLAPHSDRRDVGLLYVGIAPSREGSSRTIQSRILRNHLGGNTNNSTFRFSLASLLVDSLTLNPLVRGRHIYLPNDQNTALTDWLRANAFVSWHTVAEPWVIEPAVIERMKPPANLDDNLHHPFYAKMKRLRAAFRATAPGAKPESIP